MIVRRVCKLTLRLSEDEGAVIGQDLVRERTRAGWMRIEEGQRFRGGLLNAAVAEVEAVGWDAVSKAGDWGTPKASEERALTRQGRVRMIHSYFILKRKLFN